MIRSSLLLGILCLLLLLVLVASSPQRSLRFIPEDIRISLKGAVMEPSASPSAPKPVAQAASRGESNEKISKDSSDSAPEVAAGEAADDKVETPHMSELLQFVHDQAHRRKEDIERISSRLPQREDQLAQERK